MGRFVAGIGVGYTLMIASMYIVEVALASSRRFLTSFPEIFINIDMHYIHVFLFALINPKIEAKTIMFINLHQEKPIKFVVILMK